MKLKSREQKLVGIGSVIAVIVVGWWGIGGFGISPQFDSFNKLRKQLSEISTTVKGNDTTIQALEAQVKSIDVGGPKMPVGKKVASVNFQTGQTAEQVKLDLLSKIIEMSQEDDGNTLIYVKPLGSVTPAAAPMPVPEAQPAPPGMPGMPGMPGSPEGAGVPAPQIGDLIEMVSYEIGLRGNYQSLEKFINDIAKYDTIIEISRIEVAQESEDATKVKDVSKTLKAIFKINLIIRKS